MVLNMSERGRVRKIYIRIHLSSPRFERFILPVRP